MTSGLPPEIKAAIAEMLAGVSRKEIAARAEKMSASYRAGGGSATAVADAADVLAYLVTRMPATYAAASAVFRQVALAVPAFAPKILLDVGAGPGTASFAAVAAWPEIKTATMIDANRHFINAAGEITAASSHAALANSTRVLADATRFGRDLPKADLVIAAYTLAEIGETDAGALIVALWAACGGALVLVEPGTPAGFARIRDARTALIDAGASIAAPCPHSIACPIVAPDWCHFAERLSRSREHRLAKSADAPFEDEKYSYVVAARSSIGIAPYELRVLAPPRSSKAELRLKLCTNGGTIAERTVPRRDREAHARLRRLWWGDAIAETHSGSQGHDPESGSNVGPTAGSGSGRSGQ